MEASSIHPPKPVWDALPCGHLFDPRPVEASPISKHQLGQSLDSPDSDQLGVCVHEDKQGADEKFSLRSKLAALTARQKYQEQHRKKEQQQGDEEQGGGEKQPEEQEYQQREAQEEQRQRQSGR